MSRPSTSPRSSCVTGHLSVMIGGVRFARTPRRRGGVELLEVMNIVDGEEAINEAGREDAWKSDTPISPVRTPVAPLRLHLFDHHRRRHRRHHHHRLQNGYADTALPSSRSSTHTRAVRSSRFRQRIASTRGRGIAPATTNSAYQSDQAPVPPAAVHDRRADAGPTACVRVPPAVSPSFSPTVCARTAGYPSTTPYTPQLYPGPYLLYPQSWMQMSV